MKFKAFRQTLSVLLASTLGISALPLDPFVQTVSAVNTAANSGVLTVVQAEEDPTALKNGDVNADGIVDAADAEAILNVKLSDCPQADVNADGVLDQTDADMIASFVSGEISYFPVGVTYNADAGYITRGEWIHELSVGFGMEVEDESSIVEYFTDISGTAYEEDINLAANFGVFDILEEEFHPDEFVTRDFAAHTMNFCLGYPNDVTILFTDTDDVYYDGDAQIALTQGWFLMVEGQFRPSMYVTSAEGDLAYADMKTAVESSQIDEDHEDEMTLNSEVKEINDAESIDMNGTTFTITGTSVEIEEGDTISFPYADTVLVRLVTKVTSDNGVLTVETDDAEEEMVQSAEAEGYALIDYEGYEILSEGLTVETVDSVPAEPKAGARYNLSGTGKLDKTFKIGGTFDMMGTPLTLKGTISNIRVPYSFDKNFLGKVNYFYLGVDADVNLEASISYSDSLVIDPSSMFGGRSIPLLSIPVLGYSNFGANLVISAQVSVSGTIKIQYGFTCGAGVEYKNGSGWRVIKNFKQTKFTAEASVEEKIGVKIEVNAKIGKSKIGEVYAAAGEVGKVYIGGNAGSNMTCLDVKAYLYMEIGANLNILNLLKYKNTWTIFDIDNSPVKIAMHWENGNRVAKCTAGKSTAKAKSDKVSGTGGSSSGKKSGGYVKGSGYTTGYTKAASTGSGNAATGFTPVYYKSTIVFKELEPPTVISEDMVLTEDTTYHTGLEITGNTVLDLNGHTLTVDGDMTVNAGYRSDIGNIKFNGGSIVITGNLIGTYGRIVMNDKNDKLTVKGNVVNKELEYKLTAGKTTFSGDVSIPGYSDFSASDMHQTILDSKKDQTLQLDSSSPFNQLVVNNSDTRKIKINNDSLIVSGVTTDGKKLNIETANGTIEITTLAVPEVTIDGNCSIRGCKFTGEKMTINGNVTFFDNTFSLLTNELDVNGDVTISQIKFALNGDGCTLKINGSCTADFSGSTYWFDRGFKLNHKKDYMLVTGKFTLNDPGSLYWNAGITELQGDVYLNGRYTDNSWIKGTHTLILSGAGDQVFYMDDVGGVNNLIIKNSEERNIIVDGYMSANTLSTENKELKIKTNDIPSTVGQLSLGTVDSEKISITGAANFYRSTILNGTTLDISDAVSISGTLQLNLATMNCAKGLAQTNGTLNVGEGTVNVEKNYDLSGGVIQMDNSKALIDIKGNLKITRADAKDNITDGTIQCAGDITGTGAGLLMKDKSKFILNGEADQTLGFASFNTTANTYHFANLEVKNSASRNIILDELINCGNIYADSDAITMTSTNGRLGAGKLYTDLNITGDVTKRGNEFDLNGHTLNIEGNLYQELGTITPNTGNLLISGDYMIVSDHDSAVYGTSDGILNMVNDGDYVLVGGSFVTKTKKDHSKNLTAGTLEIKGNFTQFGGGTAKAFPASGTHKAILSGDDTQKVTFESYPDSHFNILQLTKDVSNYEFSDEECWNELVSETDPGTEEGIVGDANGDNVVDLKDVMVIRRFYAGGWDVTINEEAADVNHDGSVDLKDALIIRRYYAGGWDIELN